MIILVLLLSTHISHAYNSSNMTINIDTSPIVQIKSIDMYFVLNADGSVDRTIKFEGWMPTDTGEAGTIIGNLNLPIEALDDKSITLRDLHNPDRQFTETATLNEDDCLYKYVLDRQNQQIYYCHSYNQRKRRDSGA